MLPRVLILLVLVWMPGCAYLANRARDAHECLLFDAQFGVGVSADAKAGPFAAGVGGSYGIWTVGKSTWWSDVHSFQEASVGVPFTQIGGIGFLVSGQSGGGSPGAALLFATHFVYKYREVEARRASNDAGAPASDSSSLKHESLFGRWAPLGISCFLNDWPLVDYFGFEASAFVGCVGARVGVNLAEFGDFVTGWFGLDILGDDVDPPKEEDKPPEPRWRAQTTHPLWSWAR